jgi:hypothetical protein
MTGPGAGAELKHLLNGVKSKSKPEGLDLKPKGSEAEPLDIKDKGFDLKANSLNLKVLDEAVKGAKKGNRQTIAVWSPEISAVLWYLKATTPLFSISDEARGILEEGLLKKYPELFQRVKDEMDKGK